MARRVAEPVEVRVAGERDDTPTSFLWRGRLYVVRAVLGHWLERREWWNGEAARAVHGDGPGRSGTVTLERESWVWRVEAGAGRAFGTGVYELRQDPTGPAWHLVRVAD